MGIRTVKTYRSRGGERRRGGFFFRLIAIVSAAALLLSYLSLFFNPAEFPLLLFFGLYFVPLLLLNILLLCIALFKLRLSLFIPLIALLPSLFIIDRFVQFGKDAEEAGGENVRILTYNLGRYDAGGRKVTQNEAVSEIKRFLSEQDADIVCLQEFAVKDTAALSTYLPLYPYMTRHLFPGKRAFGNVTLSKYPIIRSETMTFPDSRNLSLVSDISIGGMTVRVYNCHLESYRISFTALVKKLFHKDTFTDEVVQVHGRLREATLRRAEQVSLLLQDEAKSPFPNIVCGDFNDNPVSYTYQTLVKTKKDSFVESGSGFSSSYSLLWPMLRLDYILFPQDFWSSRHETFRVPWSDHYPVSTVINLSL